MKEVKLSKGQVSFIDDDDYERVVKFKWNHGTRCVQSNNGLSTIKLHRFILNAQPGQEIDHIDGNVLNNQKSNLRFCTHQENSRNRKSWGKSKFLGVTVFKQKNKYETKIKYRATIVSDGKQISLGLYDNEIDAAKQYDKFAKIYHGDYANLNFKD